MKVLQSGTAFFDGNLNLYNWMIDIEGREVHDHDEMIRVFRLAALIHIASACGITLVEVRVDDDPSAFCQASPEVVRAAADAIAAASRATAAGPMAPKRPWLWRWLEFFLTGNNRDCI